MSDRAGTRPRPARQRLRTDDPGQAEALFRELLVGVRLDMPREAAVDMRLATGQVGRTRAASFSFGRELVKVTDELEDFYVLVPLRGRVRFRGAGHDSVATPSQGVVYSQGVRGTAELSADCRELCLRVPHGVLCGELEQLLGRPLTTAPRFDFVLNTQGAAGRAWRTSVELLVQELEAGAGLHAHPVAARHIEGLLLDSLLLAQSHSYSDDLLRSRPAGGQGAIRRAVELLQESPGEAWSTVRLAGEVHLSVRALQEGFSRDVGMPPMAYLRQVRLQRARRLLQQGDPDRTTVKGVAGSLGFVHLGRFTGAYREAFGEYPSQTLRASRPAP